MEAVNQFLEENATIYDSEADSEKSSEDTVYIYSGEALDMQGVFQFSCVNNIKPVIVAGEQGSGKTTLEVMMYRLFLEGKNERFQFAGSYTMKGFRKRSENLLKKSGSKEPNVSRTLRGDKKFLHLAVCGKSGKREHLMFADYAGELFEDPSCLKELGEFFAGAANVVVTLDGEKICSPTDRQRITLNVFMLLTYMQKAGIFSQCTYLYIVCTKFDRMKKSEKKDSAINFLEKEYEELRKTFQSKVGKMKLVYICAYGINEKEERDKMEELLSGFTEEREYRDLIPLEEQIEVKRQMDKFKVRG
ncbi:MAG: hypothetical protein HP054_07935 [Blautia sp.]|nr:hypothetical protein [Blautia sp.]